jgi:hypothetical protein
VENDRLVNNKKIEASFQLEFHRMGDTTIVK